MRLNKKHKFASPDSVKKRPSLICNTLVQRDDGKTLHISHLIIFLFFFVSQCAADSITLDFRIEKKNKSNETITTFDRKTGETIYFEKAPSLTIMDIERAECRFEKLDGYYMSAKSIYDENVAFTDDMIPTIDFHLNEAGQKKISSITTQNIGNRMGMFLNNKLIMAPVISGKIKESVFSLAAAGAIGVRETKELVDKINNTK